LAWVEMMKGRFSLGKKDWIGIAMDYFLEKFMVGK
jgi:hypothetical protein